MLLSKTLLTALLCFLPQDSGGQDAQRPVQPTLRLGGGIQAPTQPRGKSTARVRRTARFTPASTGGRMGLIKTPIRSVMAVRGQEDNVILGIGLVTGLAGTGDGGELARQMQRNWLLTHNLPIDPKDLKTENTAVVMIEAELPAGLKPGRLIDARVSSIGDAESLLGGTLLITELTDMSGNTVYATASGPITVGGFKVESDSASVVRNHVTVGMLPRGCRVQREVPTQVVTDHGYIYLDARTGHDSFTNLVNVAAAINRLYPQTADAQPDGKTVRIKVPASLAATQHIAFIESILQLEIESVAVPRVVINERTGVIVMGGDVRLRPGAIASGNLTVTIANTDEISQPGALSEGTTERVTQTDILVVEENNPLIMIPGAVNLQEVVDVLNLLGATPRDMISIIGQMSEAGMLVAEIVRR